MLEVCSRLCRAVVYNPVSGCVDASQSYRKERNHLNLPLELPCSRLRLLSRQLFSRKTSWTMGMPYSAYISLGLLEATVLLKWLAFFLVLQLWGS